MPNSGFDSYLMRMECTCVWNATNVCEETHTRQSVLTHLNRGVSLSKRSKAREC